MFDAANEFDFWGRQIVEHALIAHLALEEPALKGRALEFHRALKQAYDARDLTTFLSVLQQFIAFKQAALQQQRAGAWLGWAFPSLVQHMIDEEEFFLARVHQQPATVAQIMSFWLKERAGEAEVAAHLIDPSETAAVAKMSEAALRFTQLDRSAAARCDAIVVALAGAAGVKANRELLAMQPNRPLSLISPDLKAHVAREGERFVETTQRLLGTR